MKKNNIIKKLIMGLVLSLIVCNIPIYKLQAAEKNDEESIVAPCYSYTGCVVTNLFFDNGSALCDTYVEGFYNVTTKITITQTLQRKSGTSWVDVWSWTDTKNNWYFSYTNYNFPLNKGTTYRVKSYIKVYSGTKYETIYSYSSESVF